MTVNLREDLRARWRPSDRQIAAADALLAASGDGAKVLTAHLLVNKEYGIWTEGVEVVPLDGVFTDRSALLIYLEAYVAESGRATGKPTIGGYAWHPRPGEWAVFEDIVAVFPRAVR